MSISRIEKEGLVKEIEQKLQNSKTMVIVNYHKLNVPDMLKLRDDLRKTNSELKVYKNRIFKIAAKNAGKSELNEFLIGQNAFSFSSEDSVDNFKKLYKFSKTHKSLKLIGGIYENNVINGDSALEIAKLPSKEDLICMFASGLNYSLIRFALTLQAVADKKEA